LQARLLRFLDQGTVRALGSSTEEKVDVQILAATNCSIEEAVELKRFRTDLLYRIRGVEVTLPPLRERTDFVPIVKTLLSGLAQDCSISDEAIAVLKQHQWPGNFRELKYSLVRMLIAAKSSWLLPSHALSVLSTFPAAEETSSPTTSNLKEHQGKLIIETYQRCHGNVVHTAKELAVSRNTVYRELRRSGLR
jgi:sigma-54 dependent transcriptional regulator, acetoin dehydrogenase operon transcriptional activator AcoR